MVTYVFVLTGKNQSRKSRNRGSDFGLSDQRQRTGRLWCALACLTKGNEQEGGDLLWLYLTDDHERGLRVTSACLTKATNGKAVMCLAFLTKDDEKAEMGWALVCLAKATREKVRL